jgi:hypothetical protein
MKKLVPVGKVVLILLSGPLVIMAAVAVGQLYALMALLALPFLLAFEMIDRKLMDASLARRELDLLQRIYPDVPRHLLRQARLESLLQEAGHGAHESLLSQGGSTPSGHGETNQADQAAVEQAFH